ncbi:MAG: GNAT family N-acetyltransferase [Candidatus Limnocylindrales bacterium]
MGEARIVDVTDLPAFGTIPPCADTRFDHRTCDYWEDGERGSKDARVSWLAAVSAQNAPRTPRPGLADNPFAPAPKTEIDPFALLAGDDDDGADDVGGALATPDFNPFAPQARRERPLREGVPRKLALLDRGRGIFGSYAKVMSVDGESVAYAQFGPLSAYPRALRLRELYPQLPDAPPPAIITCVATTPEARRQGLARRLVEDICRDLGERGFSAVEAYPDLTRDEDESSAGRPIFWHTCGFVTAVDDERYPVMRRELD